MRRKPTQPIPSEVYPLAGVEIIDGVNGRLLATVTLPAQPAIGEIVEVDGARFRIADARRRGWRRAIICYPTLLADAPIHVVLPEPPRRKGRPRK